MYQKPYIIAEAGCNHMGRMEIARDLIQTAAIFCKADAIKFQKRCVRELLTKEQYQAPHPNPVNSYGETYGAHREFLEFDADQHAQLKVWCEEFGITYASSVWDLTSAKEIAALCPKFIKIPSADYILQRLTAFNTPEQISKAFHYNIIINMLLKLTVSDTCQMAHKAKGFKLCFFYTIAGQKVDTIVISLF